MPARRNVFSTPPGIAFLDALVAALLDGRLIPGFDAAADPFALSTVTIYLPTRRSVRAIREHILNRIGPAVLLPDIRPIGDIDEDGLVFDAGRQKLDPDTIPPPVDAAERQLFLTRLILQWSNALERRNAGMPAEPQLVPSSPADAAQLAALLADLIDAVAAGEADWGALDQIVSADLAHYWEITLQFLKIATENWPKHLATRGLSDPGERRDRLIRLEAERLRRDGSHGPVIAAGSTGSIAATADLLAAIAQLPNGALVLPGLDFELDDDAWASINKAEDDPVIAGHPQFGLARLIRQIGIERADVQTLADPAPDRAARNRLVSEAMRPAATTHLWSSRAQPDAGARTKSLNGVGLIEARNEREEALAIAVLLRRTLEQEGRVAALVTPDRKLARRVIAELERWNVRVDDSAGIPLIATPPGILARLVADVAISGGRAEKLLALLKHPAVALGGQRAQIRRAARALECAVLRGPRLRAGFAALRAALEDNHRTAVANRTADGARKRLPRSAASLDPEAWEAALDLAGRLETALQPLADLAGSSEDVPLAKYLDAHWRCLQALCHSDDAQAGAAMADEAVDLLSRRFAELSASAEFGPSLVPADYPAFFDAVLGNLPVRPRGADPRVHIWGALEARLQHVDIMVLGGLNEGVWPFQTSLDPFLSRGMRETLHLEPPERRIGLAAHDFAQAMGHDQVWLTRAVRQDGEPRIASRWLQRLTAYAGEEAKAALKHRGDQILGMAHYLDDVTGTGESHRPCPAPALALRPRRLPVTAIETLIRDPYSIHARYILRLNPFEPVAGLPGPAERGSLFHDVLERFVSERPAGPFDDAARKRLLQIGREQFDAYRDFPDVDALWWPRFCAVADWFVCHEAANENTARRLTEVVGTLGIHAQLDLTVRADRIDVQDDGRIAIVDYKTGSPSSPKEVLTVAPQLLLEALIAEAGGFKGVAAADVVKLAYYHLTGTGAGGKMEARGERKADKDRPAITLEEAKQNTWTRLRALSAFYADPANGYLSRKIPNKQTEWRGDYDHLARVAEWSIEGDE